MTELTPPPRRHQPHPPPLVTVVLVNGLDNPTDLAVRGIQVAREPWGITVRREATPGRAAEDLLLPWTNVRAVRLGRPPAG